MKSSNQFKNQSKLQNQTAPVERSVTGTPMSNNDGVEAGQKHTNN